MGMVYRVILGLLAWPLVLCAKTTEISIRDVRPMMQGMMNLHVEYNEINATLMQRAFKVFIAQFDPQKIYLTSAEAHPYLDMNERKLMSCVANYFHDEYGDFVSLSRLMGKASVRSQEWRGELQREFALASSELPLEPRESYFAYAGDEVQLRERLKRQFVNFLAEEKQSKPHRSWSPKVRERIGSLWDKRLTRHEKSYVSDRVHYLALHILKSMARGLDSHSSFYSLEEAMEMRAALEKQFEGIGVVLVEGVDGVEIADLIEGGPAHKSGRIAIGDLIVEINGQDQIGASYDDVLSALQVGSKSSPIALGLKRVDTEGKEQFLLVELKREKIILSNERVHYETIPCEGGVIGKIVLPSFYESRDGSSCEKDLRESLRRLKKQGDLKGIVIDMRENSGGFLNQAVKVAGLFMTSGVVVISKYARGEMQYLRNLDGRMYYNGPLVILTSKLSASATEIVAQALQDYGMAVVVGDERTYGKGTIQFQTVTDADAKAFYKVTVGRYYTVSGRSTQIEGVKADLVVPSFLAAYPIGEKYLDYPLNNDRVPAAYHDPLSDIDLQTRPWFQKNYLPNLQQKQSHWTQLIPELKKRSAARMKSDPQAIAFYTQLKEIQSASVPMSMTRNWWDGEDWQLDEAIEIVKDMIQLSSQ